MRDSTKISSEQSLLLRSKGKGVPKWNALLTILLISALAVFIIPLGLWSGLYDPKRLHYYSPEWPDPWGSALAIGCIAALIIIPLTWVFISGTLDLIAFFLVENALLIVGYFFLGTTAWKLDVIGTTILQRGALVVLINAIGFAAVLIFMGLTYFVAVRRGILLRPLRNTPEVYDNILLWFLRGAGIVNVAIITLPMVRTGVIPLLANDMSARAVILEDDLFRALYLLGHGLMPFVTSGLLVFCARKPLRFLGPDGWIAFSLLAVQILSGNRNPLAIAFFVTFALITMERRFSRTLLILVFSFCMVLFTALSGFSGLLRGNQEELGKGNFLTTSLTAAFTGDNLIDVRDGAWVMSKWDFNPLMGTTYLGGLFSMMPSGIFPQKKEWHLGQTALRIVGWDATNHFGLRISTFGEAFLNFGLAGVLILGTLLGILFGSLLRVFHQAAKKRPPCLNYNLKIVILMQMCTPLANSSEAFTFWALCGFMFLQWFIVDGAMLLISPATKFPLFYAANRT